MKDLRQFTMGTGYRDTGFYVRGTGHFIIEHQKLDKFADYCEIFWCIDGFSRRKDQTQLLPVICWASFEIIELAFNA